MAMPEDMCMRMYLCRIGSQQPRGHSLSFRLRLLLPCRRLMAALPSDLGRPPLLPPHPQPAPPLDLLFADPGRPLLLPPQPQPAPPLELLFTHPPDYLGATAVASSAPASNCPLQSRPAATPSTTSTNTVWALSLGKCGQRIDQRCRIISWAIFEGG